jgi:hypothetical protein
VATFPKVNKRVDPNKALRQWGFRQCLPLSFR